jgi:hypothetical protein
MNHSDPQAAPPETDLRAMSSSTAITLELTGDQVETMAYGLYLAVSTVKEQLPSAHASAGKLEALLAVLNQAVRRLARPDALRETDLTADEIYLDRECLVDIVWADLAHRDVTVADADHVADTLMAAGFHRDRPEQKPA